MPDFLLDEVQEWSLCIGRKFAIVATAESGYFILETSSDSP